MSAFRFICCVISGVLFYPWLNLGHSTCSSDASSNPGGCCPDGSFVAHLVRSALRVYEQHACCRSEFEGGLGNRVPACSKQAGQSSAAALASDNDFRICHRVCQHLHRGSSVLFIDSHESSCQGLQQIPCDERRFVAFEHRHERGFSGVDLDTMTG